MTLNDISNNLSATLLASLGQSGSTRSTTTSSDSVNGSDAVTQAFNQADQRVKQQQSSTQVSLSAFGQLRSSVDQLQQSSKALTNNDNTNTPEKATAAAQNFVKAFNNAQTTARNVTNSDNGALAGNARAAVATSQIGRTLNSNSGEQLREIGINRNQNGTLSIDQQRFQQALQNTPQQVSSALSNVGQQVQSASSNQLSNNSQINRAVSTLTTQSEALAAQQKQLQTQQQQATQATQTQQDQAAQQQQAQQQVQQQTQQQASDVGNSFNAIAAAGVASYQKIFSL